MNLVERPDPLREWSDAPDEPPHITTMFIVFAVIFGAISAATGFVLRVLWEMWR